MAHAVFAFAKNGWTFKPFTNFGETRRLKMQLLAGLTTTAIMNQAIANGKTKNNRTTIHAEPKWLLGTAKPSQSAIGHLNIILELGR